MTYEVYHQPVLWYQNDMWGVPPVLRSQNDMWGVPPVLWSHNDMSWLQPVQWSKKYMSWVPLRVTCHVGYVLLFHKYNRVCFTCRRSVWWLGLDKASAFVMMVGEEMACTVSHRFHALFTMTVMQKPSVKLLPSDRYVKYLQDTDTVLIHFSQFFSYDADPLFILPKSRFFAKYVMIFIFYMSWSMCMVLYVMKQGYRTIYHEAGECY